MSIVKLAASKAKMENAIQWMSGSADFAPNGIARKGFIKLVKPILDDAIIKSRVTTLDSVINGNSGSV